MSLRIFVAVLLLAVGVSAAEPCDNVLCDGKMFHFGKPGPVAIGLHAAALALIAADVSTTLDLRNHPRAIEVGPVAQAIVGGRPSGAAILSLGVGTMALHTTAWYFAPREGRVVLDILTIAIETVVVTGNLEAGFSFQLP